MAAVVLVHGLYHRPEHFAVVAEGLRADGTEVAVPELHRGSLTADTAAVQAVIDALPESPVVLGHSYGGSVITGVRGAAHLVYLAAFVLDTGESAAVWAVRPNSSRTPSSLSRTARPPCTPASPSTPSTATAQTPSPRGRSACCVRKPRAADEESPSITAGRRLPRPTSSAHRTAPSTPASSGPWPHAAPTCANGRQTTHRSWGSLTSPWSSCENCSHPHRAQPEQGSHNHSLITAIRTAASVSDREAARTWWRRHGAS